MFGGGVGGVGPSRTTGSAQGGGQVRLGVIACMLATANMVGGFVVTDRMLEMFKGRSKAKAAVTADAKAAVAADAKDVDGRSA